LLLIVAATFSYSFGQDSLIVFHPDRLIKLEAGANFRDLGGYPTRDNKHIIWGQIYRSADISKLTDNDLLHLTQLNVATICDLRGPAELKASPDRVPPGVNYINLPAGSEQVQHTMNYANLNTDSLMQSIYANTSFLVAKYKPMFEQLLALNAGKSLVFHCTAGKDRTGIGAALILSALGVSRSYVEADYAATNVFWKDAQVKMISMLEKSGVSNEKARAMIAAKPSYIQNFLNTIDQKFGSMDKFLKGEMGLNDADFNLLQARFVK
jgi:protein-tyrosine phosphatase